MAKERARKLFVVGTDGSKASDKALRFAAERAGEAGARLLVVMAIPTGAIGAPSSSAGAFDEKAGEVRDEAKAVVGAAVAWAKRAGLDASGRVLEHDPMDDVASSLVKFAKERRAHTIFVGSHGRAGIARVLLGSTAEKVARLSHCPVSIVR